MPKYQVQCPEFSPSEAEHLCHKFVDVEIPIADLSKEEVLTYIDEHDVHVPVCAVHGSDVDRDANGNVIND
jgi:hypothetical protein